MAKTQTSWKKGQSGNLKGRPEAGWSWSELLREVGEEIEPKTGKQFKKLVSKRLWIECLNGNVGAIKELMNRMDGMPKQTNELTGKNGEAIEYKYSDEQLDAIIHAKIGKVGALESSEGEGAESKS